MTTNQIRFNELEETARANKVRETETERSNRAKEQETKRHNKKMETYQMIDSISNVGRTVLGKGGFPGAIGSVTRSSRSGVPTISNHFRVEDYL